MSDRFQTDASDAQPPDISVRIPPLPSWLAGRLLRADETITWVVGPRFNPSWERYATHPALFLFALALGAISLGIGWMIAGTEELALPVLISGGIVLGSVFVLGLSSGYFTRLVVTNSRLVILQGYEVCRSWGLDELPLSLVRYRTRGGETRDRAVDLDALKTLFGASDRFAEAKTILAFGKQLDRIKSLENGRP